MTGRRAVIDRVERLTNLLALLLETSRPLTLVEIAGELRGQYPEGEANRRAMFERDKAALRGIGVPIETAVRSGEDAGVSEYWIDRERYELADLALEPDETRALQTAFATIRSASGGEIAAESWRCGSSAPRAPTPSSRWSPTCRSCRRCRPCATPPPDDGTVTFRYHGDARRRRPVRAAAAQRVLVRHRPRTRGRPAAHATASTASRATSRSPARTAPSNGPPGSTRRDHVPDRRQAASAWASAVVVDAVVRVGAERAAMIEREVGSEHVLRRHADGAVDVVVPCANVGAFRSWVLGLIDHAEVLGPPEVRGGDRAAGCARRRTGAGGRHESRDGAARRCRCPAAAGCWCCCRG